MEQLFNEEETAAAELTGAEVEVALQEAADAAIEVMLESQVEAKFGEQLANLEGIVTQLESGQLDLEDSLKSYEEGVQLIRSLQAKLAAAEQKVQAMMGEITAAE